MKVGQHNYSTIFKIRTRAFGALTGVYPYPSQVTHKNTEWRKPDRKAENGRLNRKERTANTNYFLEGNKAKRIGK